MIEHTKGPWQIDTPHTRKLNGPSIWADGMLVGQVAGLAEFDYSNARLIASAPEMLEALRLLVVAKDIKDQHGDCIAYRAKKVEGWKAARALVSSLEKIQS